MKYFLMIVILLMSSLQINGKVLIFTYSYNKPEFIELQYKTFKKFLLDDHELVVFNDAREQETALQIKNMCKKYGLQCIPIPQEIHDRPYLDKTGEIKHEYDWVPNEYHSPSVRNSNVVQYSLDTFGFEHDDILILVDSDLFLIKEFSFRKYLKNYDLAGYNRIVEYSKNDQIGINYLWIGLIFINMKSLPNKTMFNINCSFCNNVLIDTGGQTHYYIKHNHRAHIKYFDKLFMHSHYCNTCKKEKSYRCFHNTTELKSLGFDNKTIAFIQEVPIDWFTGVPRTNEIVGVGYRNIEFLLNNNFVHFAGASGYASSSTNNFDVIQFYKDKTKAFVKYIDDILQV